MDIMSGSVDEAVSYIMRHAAAYGPASVVISDLLPVGTLIASRTQITCSREVYESLTSVLEHTWTPKS